MKAKLSPEAGKKLREFFKKYKYLLVIIAAGVILISIPTGPGQGSAGTGAVPSDVTVDFSLPEQEEKMAQALKRIEGAGEVAVMLTLKSGAEQVLAADRDSSLGAGGREAGDSESSESTVIVSAGSGVQSTVPLKVLYPQYMGALVVAQGADDPTVKLELIRAVAGLTGLGTDKITVTKMKAGYEG